MTTAPQPSGKPTRKWKFAAAFGALVIIATAVVNAGTSISTKYPEVYQGALLIVALGAAYAARNHEV